MIDNDFLADMLGDFIDESEGQLRQLNENLLEVEEWVKHLDEGDSATCDIDLLNEMFRAAHNMKGLSGMLGLEDINALTHKVENVFEAARQDQLAVNREVVDVVFQAVDRLTEMVDRLKEHNEEPVDCESITDDIKRILSGAVPAEEADESANSASESGESTPEEAPTPEEDASQKFDVHFGRVVDEQEIHEKYLSMFNDDTDEAIDQLVDTLLNESTPEATESMLVICHRIKGSAASLGLNRSAKLFHFLEDILQDADERKSALDQATATALHKCVESLRGYTDHLRNGDPNCSEAIEILRTAFSHIVGVLRPVGDSLADEDGLSQYETADQPEAASEANSASMAEESKNSKSEALPDTAATATANAPATNGSAVAAVKAAPTTTGEATTKPKAPANAAPPEQKTAAASAPAKNKETSNGTRSSSGQKAGKPAETVRVDIDRLDQLMNLAGQLVINKARFGQIGDGLKSITTAKHASNSLATAMDLLERVHTEVTPTSMFQEEVDTDSIRRHVSMIQNDLQVVERELKQLTRARPIVNQLCEAVHQLDRVADGIQKSVMDTRMVPIGPLFARFRRVVRDITQKTGKEIQLVIKGEKTELDKRMIDEIGDPLIHMIRNSCDHGIELPDDREAVGKKRCGEVTLDAFHRGNRIIIQVKDDGKGLDPTKIVNKALSRGIITAADAEKMTPQQIYQLIWEPGFSTAEQITEVSGRGMGMDIVQSKIESLNGAVDLDSEPGVGSTFTIKLPLTMAILPSLLAEIDGDTFAIPVESVVEIVSVGRNKINTIHGVTTAQVRGRVISVVDLADMFEWNQPARSPMDRNTDVTTMVIVGVDDREMGIIVHELLGEEDIVIKSLAENYRNVTGVAGASILGDGRVSLILDVASLLEISCRGTGKVAMMSAS